MNTNQICLGSETFSKSFAIETAKVVAGAAFLALASKVAIPLPFTPVPVTMQTLALFALGAALGRKAFYSALLWVGAGVSGLPVFMNAVSVLGPTGGYILSFPFAAFIVGYFAEKNIEKSVAKFFISAVLAELVIYSFGLAWLGRFTGYGAVLSFGLYPFIAGDIFKICLAAVSMPHIKNSRYF